jgi:hypothetical protein
MRSISGTVPGSGGLSVLSDGWSTPGWSTNCTSASWPDSTGSKRT